MSTTPEQIADRYVEEEEEEKGPPPCGILGRYPILSVMIFAAVGVAVGLGLSVWDPDDTSGKDKTIKWIGLIGDLFIRAIKCVVVPLVFVSVILAVVDMMSLGRASAIGLTTLGLYLCTTVIASTIGVVTILCFQGLFIPGEFEDPSPATISLGCNTDGFLLTEASDGSVTCAASEDSSFNIVSISKTFVRTSDGIASDISLSDTIYDGVFGKLISSNITDSFANADFAAIVVFAIVFGVAVSQVARKNGAAKEHVLLSFLTQLNDVLMTLINWIILCTPLAVLSLIAQAIGSQSELRDSFSNVGYLVLATIVGGIVHYLITYILGYFLLTKKNPFAYLKFIIPAQMTAFACASSAATLPVALRSVKSSGMVPDTIARFVLPLGATVNMDGGAIYYPCACVWLAVLNGINITVAQGFLLVVLSTIGSAGAAPVPSSGLVMIITAYNTIFDATGTPNGLAFIVAIDWFIDRLVTVMNVTGDAVVAGIVAARNPNEGLDMPGKSLDEVENSMPSKAQEEEVA
jgi:Na+/H+-dicarboxylate symporter